MCGIAGYWKNQNLEKNCEENIGKMLAMIHHRGPDGEDYFMDRKEKILMGHTRLSIIDLETGSQPLYSNDRSIVLTVNGEFYDFKQIRTSLRLEGAEFSTKSDSEIAIPLYQKHGLGFVEHLRGEFAIALFDAQQKRLILARDRFGIKPLFYHVGDGALFYGSEVKAIFAHPDVRRRFSPNDVVHQLMHTMVPGSTAYEGILAVKPGHMVIIDLTNDGFEVREKEYWDMEFPKENDRDVEISDIEHIEKVRESLMDAVRVRLEADVPVGCYLSGGIDSCSMLGLASSMQQSPVKAFTISFDDDQYDESSIARTMAERTGADQEMIRLKAGDLYGENYIRTLWHSERTFYNTLGVAKWNMSRRVRECGYKTVVTGEGSDELFGGYPAFKRDFFLHDTNISDNDSISHRAKMDSSNKLFQGAILSEKQVGHEAFEDLCGFTPSWLQPWIIALSAIKPLFSKDFGEMTHAYDPVEQIASSFDAQKLKDLHALDKAQYTWIKTMLECQILSWGGDRVDMANSMESRPAFLDHHVAEVAREIPPNLRIKGNIEKWVLREAMKEILPEVLYKREKFAFMAPPGHKDDKKRNALRSLIEKYMSDDIVREVNVFDVKKLHNFMDEYHEDKDPVSLVRKDALINHILGLHIIYREFDLSPM